MQLCGSADFQGGSHNFVPCSQPTALLVFLSVGSLCVTEFASLSLGSESLCVWTRLGTFYLLCTTVGHSLLFADFHVCTGFLLLLMHFHALSWLLEELKLPLTASAMWRSSCRNVAHHGVSWHKWWCLKSGGEMSSFLSFSSRKTSKVIPIT